MNKFQEKSDTVYVGYNPNDLNNYITSANVNGLCNGDNVSIYNAINKEFNPLFVPSLKIGDKITPDKPFFGPGGLSLHLKPHGNIFLQLYDEVMDISSVLWSADYSNNSNHFFTKSIIKNNIISNPYCELTREGQLICYDQSSDLPEPYYTFGKPQINGSYKLIINGDYTLPSYFENVSTHSMIGNLTILNSNNNIVNTSIDTQDTSILNTKNLQNIFDSAEECTNANAAQSLISQHNDHSAARQMLDDHEIAYKIQYLNAINLTLGIFITTGYIYFLYKKK